MTSEQAALLIASNARVETKIDYIGATLTDHKVLLERNDARIDHVERSLSSRIDDLEKKLLAYANQFKGSWKTLTTIGGLCMGFGAFAMYVVKTMHP